VIVDAAPPITSGHPVIEIVIGATAVRVSPCVDAATLTTVLRALLDPLPKGDRAQAPDDRWP